MRIRKEIALREQGNSKQLVPDQYKTKCNKRAADFLAKLFLFVSVTPSIFIMQLSALFLLMLFVVIKP